MDNDRDNMIDLNWTEIKDAADSSSIVLFPLGVIEEHGPHLCLGTDTRTAEIICAQVKKELSRHGVPSIIAPSFHWGICQSTRGFVGSFNIRMETAKNLVLDIISSLCDFGFKEVYGINAHGDIDQNILFMNSFKEASEKTGIKACYCFRSEVMHFYGLSGEEDFICPVPRQEFVASDSTVKDIHAGDIETAIINKYFSSCVDVVKAKQLPAVTIEMEREMEWIMGGKTKELSVMGYAGNPANYDKVRIDEHMEDTVRRYTGSILAKRNHGI